MKNALAVVPAIFLLLISHGAAHAQAGPDSAQAPSFRPMKFEARIELVVDAPEPVKGAFTSCLTRELKSLKSVELTGVSPHYRITVMAIPNRTREENIGFTFSVLITRPFDTNLLRPLLMSKNLSDGEKRILLVMGNNYEKIEKNSLLTTSPDEIGRICKEIASGFNADLLEKDRRLWESAWSVPGKTVEEPAPQAE